MQVDSYMPIYSLKGIAPIIEPEAFVHPDAVLIGDVFILAGAFIAPGATLRGDFGRLIVKQGANVQEHCCLHGFPNSDTIVEENAHIGHGAILHGCIVQKNALIGINSTILDNAIIGENSVIGAHSLVTSKSEIEPNCLAFGNPAKTIRKLSEKEKKWKIQGTEQYHQLAKLYPQEMRPTKAETVADFNRARLALSEYSHKPSR